ncbi:hypothetical protein L207DRAFT_336221 [Hyaloscypha variabilis F]|uniref:Uncharacterized protein n=1 Tax=Hyaloscypha variabilis (strain UAMH 11265 / GT02V1 / F) TaxID=1149755 RepID=A0A2J6RNY2_HYAVF|nr:hypothetical protein L207DRAFT_336221 [Hyaloscypha variabilis F]
MSQGQASASPAATGGQTSSAPPERGLQAERLSLWQHDPHPPINHTLVGRSLHTSPATATIRQGTAWAPTSVAHFTAITTAGY